MLLFTILQKREGAYNILVDALTETKQTGSLSILTGGNPHAAIRSPGTLFRFKCLTILFADGFYEELAHIYLRIYVESSISLKLNSELTKSFNYN